MFPYMEGDRGSKHQRNGIGKVFKNGEDLQPGIKCFIQYTELVYIQMFYLVNTMNTTEEFLIWIFLSSFGSCTEICEISQTILFSSSRITTCYVVLNPLVAL